MIESTNPYAPPKARVGDVVGLSNAEHVRREHLTHEVSVRAIGGVHYIAATIFFLGSFGVYSTSELGVTYSVAFILVAAMFASVGRGVRTLRPWARVPAAVLSVVGLLAFPIGTIVNGYFLYLVLSRKGITVFSRAYREIIDATPHVTYRTPVYIWVLLGIVVATLFVAVGFAIWR